MAQTAAQHVLRIRELAQTLSIGSINFTNGFSGDAAPATNVLPTRVLPALNEYLARLSTYNAVWDTVNVNLANGTNEYTLPSDTVEVRSVRISGIALLPASRDALDAADPDSENLPVGTPDRYIKEGLQLTFVTTPGSSMTAKVRRTHTLGPLTATTDVVTGLPTHLDLLLPYGAVVAMLAIDADDASNSDRAKTYLAYANGLEMALQEMADSDQQDFSVKLSADNFVPQLGGKQIRRGLTPIVGRGQQQKGVSNAANG